MAGDGDRVPVVGKDRGLGLTVNRPKYFLRRMTMNHPAIELADLRNRRGMLSTRHGIEITNFWPMWRVSLQDHAMGEKYTLIEALTFAEGIAAHIEHEGSCSKVSA